MLINSHPGQNSNEVAACEVHVQVHSGRRSHLNEPLTEQDYITNDVEAESPPISQRAEENPGNDNVEYLERNREHNIEMVTDDDSNSEEDSSDDNEDHEQVSTSIVTSRSPPDTHPSKLNLILNLILEMVFCYKIVLTYCEKKKCSSDFEIRG